MNQIVVSMRCVFSTLLMIFVAESVMALSPLSKWVDRECEFATFRLPDECRVPLGHFGVAPRQPFYKDGKLEYIIDEKAVAYEYMSSAHIEILQFRLDGNASINMSQARRLYDEMIDHRSQGNSKIRWLQTSDSTLTGSVSYTERQIKDSRWIEAPWYMLIFMKKIGDEIYSVEGGFETNSSILTIEERRELIKGVFDSLRPKVAK